MLPTLFIGSSSEGLRVAQELRQQLKYDAEITIWHEGVFELNEGTLDSLVKASKNFDFAALVLTPDDLIESRNQAMHSPRDNVLFECGLFIGQLGKNRTYIVYDRSSSIKIPSDLAGISLATYRGQRNDGNLMAAVGEACDPIRGAIHKLGKIRSELPAFWSDFANETTNVVLGRFLNFRQFEPSGLMGVGDAMAFAELTQYIQGMGGKPMSVMYADKFDGEHMERNLIVVGGPDANETARDILQRVGSKLIVKNPDARQIGITDLETKTTYKPTFDARGQVSSDYGVIVRAVNPFSAAHRVVVVFGCYGYGTVAAAKFATSKVFLDHSIVKDQQNIEVMVRAEVSKGSPHAPTIQLLRKFRD